MKLVPLGSVAEVIAGQSPEGIYYNFNGSGTPFYQGKKAFGDRFLGAPTTWTTKITKLAQPGDILMSVRAPVGPINFSTEQICIGRGLASIRTSELIDKEFLFYFLLHKQPEISGNTGAVFDSINKDQIASIEVPLVTIEKQREIVEKLDSAFADIDLSYRKTFASLEFLTSCFDSFLHSILQDQILKFGQKKLVDVLDIARGGSPRPIDSFLTKDSAGVNWIKISDATSSKKYITETAQRIKPEGVSHSRLVHPGDFLLSNSMSFGRPYIMGTTGCIHDGWLVLSNNKKLLNQDYLYFVLGSQYIYEQFNRTAAGSTVRNLNISLAGQVTFPVPDLETQDSLVSQLIDIETAIDEIKESMNNKLSKLVELKNAFLSNSFALNDSSEAVI